MKKNIIVSTGFGMIALAAGVICHRIAPGLGLVLMPMLWPLIVLAAKVPAKWSVTTAALVPFASFLLTDMPAFPLVVACKFAVFTGVAAVLLRRIRKEAK